MSNLRIVANYAVGFNNIDVGCALDRGIYVTNTTIALSLGILLALRQLGRTGRLRWWWLPALLAGVGLWAKKNGSG